ncbi:aflatoxin regulatory [Lecanosticta acicola]|uniref:Aflatoxin regulatory n=1 Tax=Lecanosticta acicola TaxID=111012 RepID=A0AAI9EC45_9PEZI|nr:aflatoxin regulatory [Lecanosticta acicola]
MTNAKSSVKKGPRREQVANACMGCRSSKVKCSGKHPRCSRCLAKGLPCQYDVSEEGVTRRQHMLQAWEGQKRDLDCVQSVMHVLRHGTDSEAAATLARLRVGHSVEQESDRISKRPGQAELSDPDASSPPPNDSFTPETVGDGDFRGDLKGDYDTAGVPSPMLTSHGGSHASAPASLYAESQISSFDTPMTDLTSCSYSQPTSATSEQQHTYATCSLVDLHDPTTLFPFDPIIPNTQTWHA